MYLLRALTVASLLTATMSSAYAQRGSAPPEVRPRQAQRNPQDNHPGEQILMKLSSMTPEEREQALSRLPAAQRENIEKRIQNFQKMPAAQQERTLEKLERLNSLPAQKQNQVRRSMTALNKLPDDRKKAVNQELRNMTGMSGDERAAYMATEAFRNHHSLDEQQMVGDLAEILPPHE
jgi:flagellar motor switch protein FliG